jgi:hypothetical protein
MAAGEMNPMHTAAVAPVNWKASIPNAGYEIFIFILFLYE